MLAVCGTTAITTQEYFVTTFKRLYENLSSLNYRIYTLFINAIDRALKKGMHVIFLTGDKVNVDNNGNIIVLHVDVRIQVPSQNTQYIQESHATIEHILADLVEQAVFGERIWKDLRV